MDNNSIQRAWLAAIDDAVRELARDGLAESTTARMARQLRTFASSCGCGPWEVTRGQVSEWLEAVHSSGGTAQRRKVTLRTFYRWAWRTGRVATDPTAESDRSTVTDANRWLAAVDESMQGLLVEGLARSTVDRVCKHLRRFGNECGCGPWEVTSGDIERWVAGLDSSGVAKQAVYGYRTSLRTFYRWAEEHGRVAASPASGQPRRDKPIPAGWVPLLEGFARYMASGGKSDNTICTYIGKLRQLAREAGASNPAEIGRQDLADWMARHAWQRETARTARGAVKCFYQWAYDFGHIDANPATAMPRIPSTGGMPRPATETDYITSLDNADDRSYVMLRLAGDMGLRRAEVAKVNSRDVTGQPGSQWLRVHGKGSKIRQVPLPDDLASVILDAHGWLFPGNYHGHLSPQRVGNLLSRLLPDGVTMHMLRHRFATTAYRATHDLFAVQQVLGHANPATTLRYVAVEDEALRVVVAAATDRTRQRW